MLVTFKVDPLQSPKLGIIIITIAPRGADGMFQDLYPLCFFSKSTVVTGSADMRRYFCFDEYFDRILGVNLSRFFIYTKRKQKRFTLGVSIPEISVLKLLKGMCYS